MNAPLGEHPLTIGIVGAGILGRLLAWQLLSRAAATGRKVRVDLFNDKPLNQTGAPSFTAAGMLTPYSELADADALIFDLGMASLSLWPDIAKSLPRDIELRTAGSLVVAHAGDQASFQQFEQQLTRKLGDKNAIQTLAKAQLNTVSPSLCERFSHAIYLKQEAWVNSQRCMDVLASALARHSNVHIYETQKVTPAKLANDPLYNHVIDCRGLAARCADDMLRGVRGELIWLHAPQVQLKHLVRLMHPRYKLYIVPRPNDVYIIGASQIESEFDGKITVRSALELLSAAYSVHSGFAEAEIIKTDSNLRPAYPDNQPQLHTEGKLMTINGLFRHGYLLSPALCDIAIDLLFDGHSENPLAANLVKETTSHV